MIGLTKEEWFQRDVELVEKMHEAVETLYDSPDELTARLIALGISDHLLVEMFEERYHTTPERYANYLRVEAAKKLLVESSMTIQEVGRKLGFGSNSAFYTFCQRNLRMLPTDYRREMVGVREMQFYAVRDLALGWMTVFCNQNAITGVQFGRPQEQKKENWQMKELIADAFQELDEYLCGKRKTFDVPMEMHGEERYQIVWNYLLTVPYGETIRYSDLAANAGNGFSIQAVGAAVNKNPLAILIPSHRVLGSRGELKSYPYGVDIKKRLLELETYHSHH